MKKRYLFIIAVIVFCVIYLATGVLNKKKCEATYLYDSNGIQTGISYNRRNYYNWDYMFENHFEPLNVCAYDGYPYRTVMAEDSEVYSKFVFIQQDKFSDYAIFFENYFYYFSETYDKNKDFIVENFDPPQKYIDESFTFPTLENSKVNEIWMSRSEYDKITDIETINKIVECAKSNGEIALDKEIVDYIKKYSWDNHCFYLKYEGYPIVEEFHIEETEDGRYIVDQYTLEEYNSVHWYDEEYVTMHGDEH